MSFCSTLHISSLITLLLALIAGPTQGQSAAEAARYSQLNLYARTLPEKQAGTVSQLANALAQATHSDTDKARLLFTWLATHVAYDTGYLRGNRSRSYAPADVLRSRLAICQGYADLFTALARQMRLSTHTITGYARTTASSLPTGPHDTNHAWNVYQADGRWHLVDATWGAGAVTGALVFEPRFKPWYFDPPAAALVCSHLPQEPRWQLLPVPVSRTEFMTWPCVEPLLFERGVSGAALLRALARRRTPGALALPNTYACELLAQLEQVPLAAELEPSRPVVFRLETGPEVVVAIENGGRTQVLPTVGAFCEATLAPRPGPLRVLLWSRHHPGLRYTLLAYQVLPVPSLRERRQRWPDSVHVAYLVRSRAQWAGPAATAQVAAKP